MNLWQQNYDPAGNIWLSSLIASLPILFFFFALIKLKLKGYVAASWTVVIALAVALLFYKMPVDHALASVVYGFFYGLWPILLCRGNDNEWLIKCYLLATVLYSHFNEM